jgi:lambda repressor-like predicted transcriptional regulator
MRLLNVRLGPEDSRIAAELRKEGIQLSRVVREALRAAHTLRRASRSRRGRASAIMAEIYAQFPDPPGLPRRRFDLRDRRSVRRAIAAQAKRRRS